MLNIAFMSFQYDRLGAHNLQLRFVLLFKEKEVHRHLQIESPFLYAPLAAICFSNIFYLLLAFATNLKRENVCDESERDTNRKGHNDLKLLAGDDCGGTDTRE